MLTCSLHVLASSSPCYLILLETGWVDAIKKSQETGLLRLAAVTRLNLCKKEIIIKKK